MEPQKSISQTASGGKAEGDLARLVLLVFAVAPPLLLAQAFLRYYSVGLAVTDEHVLIARGWPRRMGEQVALSELRGVTLRTNWMQRKLGAGQVRLTLDGGRVVAVNDLADPRTVVGEISARLRAER